MQILGCVNSLSTVRYVVRFWRRFLQSLLGGFILMDFITCLEHLCQDYDLRYGFFVFGSFTKVSEVLGLFLLFALGLKSLYSSWIFRGLLRHLCDFREKSDELENGFYSENVLDINLGLLKDVFLNDTAEESTEKSNSDSVFERNRNTESDERFGFDSNNDGVKEYSDEDDESDSQYSVDNDDELQTEEDSESDVSALRKMIKIERRRTNAARAELVKERAASATAAEEAMAMILRLQNEKSLIEMGSIQYQRLAEEKQVHDQEVIQSLQWLVWRSESEMSLLQEELKLCRRKLNRLLKSDERDGFEEEVEEDPSSLSGYTEDVLENVLYSSLDYNLSQN